MNGRNVPSSVFLILTENCNLRCTYCFEGGSRDTTKYMSKETAFKTIDYLFDNVVAYNKTLADKDKKLDVSITFFGGEPTLCTDLMIDILYYSKMKQDMTGVRATHNIITNGTIYNEHVEKFLNVWGKLFGKNAINVQLSYDGTPDIQNCNRPCANSNQISSKLVENAAASYLDYFEKNNMNKSHLHIHACVSHENIGKLYESYRYFKYNLHINNIKFAWVMESDWDDNDLTIFDEELAKISRNMSNSKRLNIDDFPFKHFYNCSGCGSGKKLISVDTEGNIYPCHRFFFYDRNKTVIGNINNEIPINAELKKTYEDFDVSSIGDFPCQVCIALNYEMTGDINKIPNDWNTKFIYIINKHYAAFSDIVEKRTMVETIQALTDKVQMLEEKIDRISNSIK